MIRIRYAMATTRAMASRILIKSRHRHSIARIPAKDHIGYIQGIDWWPRSWGDRCEPRLLQEGCAREWLDIDWTSFLALVCKHCNAYFCYDHADLLAAVENILTRVGVGRRLEHITSGSSTDFTKVQTPCEIPLPPTSTDDGEINACQRFMCSAPPRSPNFQC